MSGAQMWWVRVLTVANTVVLFVLLFLLKIKGAL